MKRIILALTGLMVFSLSSLTAFAMPSTYYASRIQAVRSRASLATDAAYWQKQNQSGFWKYTNMLSTLVKVDPQANLLYIQKGTYRSVDVSKAVIVKVNDDGARVVGLSDLTLNAKIRMVVEKRRVNSVGYRAVLIMQADNAPVKPLDKPTVRFNASGSVNQESQTGATVSVSLSKAFSEEVKVDYVVSGTSSMPSDHGLANGTLTFAPGEIRKDINFTVADDAADELNETVIISLTNPVNAYLGMHSTYVYTIKDNDQPTLGFAATSAAGSEATSSFSLPVSLSLASPHDVTAYYAVTGTATGGGVDYTLANGTVTVPAGQTTALIPLSVVDDTLDEVDETVVVNFSSSIGGSLGTATTYTYTITDND